MIFRDVAVVLWSELARGFFERAWALTAEHLERHEHEQLHDPWEPSGYPPNLEIQC